MNSDNIKSKIINFWTFQISGWVIYAFLFYIFFYWRTFQHLGDFLGFSVTIISGFLLTTLMRQFYKKADYQNRSIFHIAIFVIVLSSVTSVIWYWTDTFISTLIYGIEQMKTYFARRSFMFFLSSNFYYAVLFISWSALYYFIKFWQEWQNQKVITAKANTLANNAQLQMLRYQINPHFLFNSLNSIRALIDEDKKGAKLMITELSEFLRYSLLNKDDSTQTLKNEIDAIRIYSLIQKRRYEDKLEFTLDIDPLAEDYPVPSFLFHPLVENAIKYGMKTSSLPLKILVKAALINEALVIEVCNSGKWVNLGEENDLEGTGTGVENVYRRLESVFPNKYKINIEEKNDWVNIVIQINKDAKMIDEKII